MLLSRFTLAQSRLLSIVVASYLVAISRLSRAADVPAASNLDVVGRPVLDAPPAAFPPPQDDDIRDDGNGAYVPEFDYFDRSLLGRQEQQLPQTFELKDNLKEEKDIAPGVTQYFVLKRGQKRLTRTDEAALDAPEARGTVHMSEEGLDQDAVAIKDEQDAETDDGDGELRRRQAGNRVWISANTCRQPNPPTNGTAGTKNHPQLVMYVSTSSQNQKPGPDSTDDLATPPTGILFESGFANFSVQANSDVYIGISAPNLEPGWFGSWHFDVAASTDGPHHSYNSNNPFLFMIDTDSDSALFITYNLSQPGTNDTDKWMENNPFKMYAFEADHVTDVTGMERSLCALQNYNRTTNISYDLSITTKFGGDLPKSQFHLQGLKAGKTYNGFLTVQGGTDVLQLPSGNTVRGGGMVFQQFNWTTKSSDTCQVIFDLDFCDSVAYAVPSNPDFKDDDNKLKNLYDKKAELYYTNFTRSLAQVACDTEAEAQYSLARTCKDCENDYKNWLCSVLIPRCEDWNAPGNFLQARNVNALLSDGSLTFAGNLTTELNDTVRKRLSYNSTRNPGIDEVTPLGPYKEMLPCEDLCFDIVRSCPPQLGFACPNSPARELSYGKKDPNDFELHCNFPGAVVKLNIRGAATMSSPQLRLTMPVALLVAMSLLV